MAKPQGVFEDIFAEGKDGRIKELNPLVVKIIN